MVKWMVVLMGLVMLPLSAQAVACGPDTDCVIGDRTYRIRMPEGHDGVTPVGAIVFVHGYRGTAAGVMRNKSLMKVASDLGVALIAVTSVGGDWSVPGAPKHGPQKEVDELAYFDRVIADVAARFPIDTDQIMVTGFSAGGMMVWNLACRRSSRSGSSSRARISGTTTTRPKNRARARSRDVHCPGVRRLRGAPCVSLV